MKILNQKKYKILIGTIISLILLFEILNYCYQIYQITWISNIYLVATGVPIWLFLWFLKKEKLTLIRKVIVNFFFILISFVYPAVLILSLFGVNFSK